MDKLVHFTPAEARAKVGRCVRARRAMAAYGIRTGSTGTVTSVVRTRTDTSDVLITWDLPLVGIFGRQVKQRDVFIRYDYERMLEEIAAPAAAAAGEVRT